MFDYDEDWYSEEFHLSGDLERKVDKTLSYFSYICYLKSRGIITKKELYFFQYELERILRNQQVQDYFYNLYHFSNKNGVPMTFKYLFEYGEKEKLFSKEMYDKEMLGIRINIATFKNDIVSMKTKDDVRTYLIHLGYLGYNQERRTAFVPNEEIRQELITAVESKSWNEMLIFQQTSEEILNATLDMDTEEVAD